MTHTPRSGGALADAHTKLASGIEAFVGRVIHETGVPGIAVEIRVGDRRMSIAAGRTMRDGPPLSTSHRFHAGCTIKLLLAVVTLELAAQSRLDVDAPIGDALPELRGTIHGRTVRIAHLLSHTSGYRGTHLLDPATRDLDWPRLIAHLRAAPQLFAPGTVFSYEHTESILLGRILERATGRSPVALVRELLLEPLGLDPGRVENADEDPLWAGRHDLDRASGRFVPITAVPSLSAFWNAAFSDFTLSTADLAVLATALLPGEAASPVSAATRARLEQAAVTLPPAFGGPIRELLPVAFGHGAAQFPGRIHGHNGLTYGQCVGLRYAPTERLAVAIGMNAMLPHLRDHVLDAICVELLGRPMAGPAPRLDVELAAFEGSYVGPGRSKVTARHAHGRLELEIVHGEHRLPVELVVDDDARVVVRCPLPQLSLGLFRTRAGDVGLLLGASAYKRVPEGARRRLHRRPAPVANAEATS